MHPDVLGGELRQAVTSFSRMMLVASIRNQIITQAKHEFDVTRIVVDLASDSGDLELLVEDIVSDLTGISSPQIIFRGDSVAIRLLVEICKATCQVLIRTLLSDYVGTIVRRKLSPRRIQKYAQKILDKILGERNHFPQGFYRMCHLVTTHVHQRHPGYHRLALSNLIFLRFIIPLMIDISISYPAAKYQHNLRDVLKLLQGAAGEAAKIELSETPCTFAAANRVHLQIFFDNIGRRSAAQFQTIPCNMETLDRWMRMIRCVGLPSSEGYHIRSIIQSCDSVKEISPETYARIIEYYWIERSHTRTIPITRSYSIDKFLSSSPETQKKILSRGSSSPGLTRRLPESSSGIASCSSSPNLTHFIPL